MKTLLLLGMWFTCGYGRASINRLTQPGLQGGGGRTFQNHEIPDACLDKIADDDCDYHSCFNEALACPYGGPSYRKPICENLDEAMNDPTLSLEAEDWILGTRRCIFQDYAKMVKNQPQNTCDQYGAYIKVIIMDVCSCQNGLCNKAMLEANKENIIKAYGANLLFLQKEAEYCVKSCPCAEGQACPPPCPECKDMVDSWVEEWLRENPDSAVARSMGSASELNVDHGHRPMKTTNDRHTSENSRRLGGNAGATGDGERGFW